LLPQQTHAIIIFQINRIVICIDCLSGHLRL